MTGVLVKRGNLDIKTDTHTRRMHVMMKAEMGMMHLQAKELQRLPVNHQNLGERHSTRKERTPLTP